MKYDEISDLTLQIEVPVNNSLFENVTLNTPVLPVDLKEESIVDLKCS